MGFLLMGVSASSDQIRLPFPIYTEDFKKDMIDKGFDFYDCNSREECSGKNPVGSVTSGGGGTEVLTHRSASIELLNEIKDIAFKNRR